MKPTTTFTALTAALAITLTACANGNDEYDETVSAIQTDEAQTEAPNEDAYLDKVLSEALFLDHSDQQLTSAGHAVCDELDTGDTVTGTHEQNLSIMLIRDYELKGDQQDAVIITAITEMCPNVLDNLDDNGKNNSPFREHFRDQ